MNEKLQEQLTTILKSATETAKQAGAFLSDDVPDVVNQLLLWHGVESFIYFTLGILLFILGVVYIIFLTRNARKNGIEIFSYYEPYWCLYLLTVIPWTISLSLLEFKWLKIWLAPKLYLIEYTATLLK